MTADPGGFEKDGHFEATQLGSDVHIRVFTDMEKAFSPQRWQQGSAFAPHVP